LNLKYIESKERKVKTYIETKKKKKKKKKGKASKRHKKHKIMFFFLLLVFRLVHVTQLNVCTLFNLTFSF